MIIFYDWILILFCFNAGWIFVSFFSEWEISLSSFSISESYAILEKNCSCWFLVLWYLLNYLVFSTSFLFPAHLHGPHLFAVPGIWFIWTEKLPSIKKTAIYLGPFPLMLAYLINKLVAFCDTWFCPLRCFKCMIVSSVFRCTKQFLYRRAFINSNNIVTMSLCFIKNWKVVLFFLFSSNLSNFSTTYLA